MAIGDVLRDMGLDQDISFAGMGGEFLFNVGIFIAVAFAVGLVTFILMGKKSYDKKLITFKEVGGKPVRVGMTMAREITLPFTSVKAFMTTKRTFLPRPSIETAKNEFWY